MQLSYQGTSDLSQMTQFSQWRMAATSSCVICMATYKQVVPMHGCCVCVFRIVLLCVTSQVWSYRRQDEDLDQLGDHVQRIGHMGLQIHDELQGQNVLLERLDEDVEGTTTRLAAAQKKINTVLQKAGLRGQLMIIGILILLLVVLIMIAFS